MMLETSVPLCMRAAREEILSSLGACDKEEAELFRRRARRIFQGAVREIQRETERQYDWSLLRLSEREIDDAQKW